MGCLVKLSKLT